MWSKPFLWCSLKPTIKLLPDLLHFSYFCSSLPLAPSHTSTSTHTRSPLLSTPSINRLVGQQARCVWACDQGQLAGGAKDRERGDGARQPAKAAVHDHRVRGDVVECWSWSSISSAMVVVLRFGVTLVAASACLWLCCVHTLFVYVC